MYYWRDQRHPLNPPAVTIGLYQVVLEDDVPSAAHHGKLEYYINIIPTDWGGQRKHQARALQRLAPHRPCRPSPTVGAPSSGSPAATYPPPSMPSIAPRDRAKRDLSSGLPMPITPIGSRRIRARYEQQPQSQPKRRNKGMKEEEKEMKKVESFLGKFKG